MQDILLLLLVGLAAGINACGPGIGGRIKLSPALVFISLFFNFNRSDVTRPIIITVCVKFISMARLMFKFTLRQAQGNSPTAMLFPDVSPWIWGYYKAGYVNFKFVFTRIALIPVSFNGSNISVHPYAKILRRIFGVLPLLVSQKMIFHK